MVLILSISNDLHTDYVIDYLYNNNIPFIRLNENFIFESSLVLEKEPYLKIKNKVIYLKDIKVIWYRKFGMKFESETINSLIKAGGVELYKFYEEEITETYNSYIKILLNQKHIFWITNPKNINVNKIDMIFQAQRLGIKTPVTSLEYCFKKELTDEFISKPLKGYEVINISKRFNILTKTTLIKNIEVGYEYIPFQIQNKIEKKFEIRIVFIDGKFYSCKIDEKNVRTKDVDHRFGLVTEMDNIRYFQFELDPTLKLKIRQLLRFYNFNFASIDFIEGIDNEFYFLEINPVGQFLFHSKEINAPIEKDIFNLIKKGYERKI